MKILAGCDGDRRPSLGADYPYFTCPTTAPSAPARARGRLASLRVTGSRAAARGPPRCRPQPAARSSPAKGRRGGGAIACFQLLCPMVRHEDEAAQAFVGSWSVEWVSRSSAIAPDDRPEGTSRSSTAVMNAYVAPRVVHLSARSRQGIAAPRLAGVAPCRARAWRLVSVEQIAYRPVNLILSGPAAGVRAMKTLAANALWRRQSDLDGDRRYSLRCPR